MEQETLSLAASYLDSSSVYKNQDNNKTYFKAFLLNGLSNKRKFRVSNLQNLHKDIDGYENLPVTLVEEGLRKGNHPNPKDANIFEGNYQNRYTYVTNAINYYRNFEVAKIVKIYKPDLNTLSASVFEGSFDPSHYYALCETTNQKMIALLEAAQKENRNVYVSPAMFSWDWTKDPQTNEVSVNSFIPTHLAIVDKPAYDPQIAYISKQTCQKDGISCYYQLLEASELENLNKNITPNKNMSASNPPNNPITNLEAYIKSQYSLDVVDQKNISAEDIVKNKDNYLIIDKTKGSKEKSVTTDVNVTPNNTITQFTDPKEEKKETIPKKEQQKETKTGFTLEDVQKLLNEQEERIMAKFKEKETKQERDQILGTYLNNDKLKSVKDKIDPEKLNKARELYGTLPLSNDQLKLLLDTSIYNPSYGSPDLYVSALALSEANREINQTEIKDKQDKKQQPQQGTLSKATEEINKLANSPITSIPPKTLPNINNYGTEFKNSSESVNNYNDSFKSNNKFEASHIRDNNPVPTTGDSIPKRFQKYIQ